MLKSINRRLSAVVVAMTLIASFFAGAVYADPVNAHWSITEGHYIEFPEYAFDCAYPYGTNGAMVCTAYKTTQNYLNVGEFTDPDTAMSNICTTGIFYNWKTWSGDAAYNTSGTPNEVYTISNTHDKHRYSPYSDFHYYTSCMAYSPHLGVRNLPD